MSTHISGKVERLLARDCRLPHFGNTERLVGWMRTLIGAYVSSRGGVSHTLPPYVKRSGLRHMMRGHPELRTFTFGTYRIQVDRAIDHRCQVGLTENSNHTINDAERSLQ